MTKIATCLLAAAALGSFAGCQSKDTTTTKKTGSYTAARRNRLGSHIPQPETADNVNSTLDPNPDTSSYLRSQQQFGGGSRGAR